MKIGDFRTETCKNAGMDRPELPWDDLQLLRLLAREGSAAGAARALHLDQTTVARRLARIEAEFGALFDRLDRRLVPTAALRSVLADLDRMAETAALVGGMVRAAHSELSGSLRISAVESVAWLLARQLGAFLTRHPDVAIAIEVENRNVSLARREADIALRLGRPADDQALTRRLAMVSFCLAGPAAPGDAAHLPLVGYPEPFDHLPEARWVAEMLPGVRPAVRVNSLAARVAAVAGGCRAALPRFVVAAEPGLAELPVSLPGPVRDLWLMVHAGRRHDPAVVAAIRWIEDVLKEAGL